jgi:phage virion morphogenesis protein
VAGASVTIKIDDAAIRRALARLSRAAGHMRPAMLEIGEEMTEATKQRFSTQTGPDGTPWAPLSPRYAGSKRKQKSPAILVLRGYLHDTLRYQADADSVEWGTDRLYGATHQFGDAGRNIPARPFLGLSADDERTILDIVQDHVGRAINE